MTPSSLNTLIDLATEQRDAAATTLGQLRGRLSQTQQQFDALVTYRDEYRARLAIFMAEGVSATRLDNYRRFLDSLDDAIAQQEKAVAHGERRVADGTHHWQDKQRRLRSFDALAERRQLEIARRQNKQDQKQTDEAAGRIRAWAHR